MRRVQLTLVSTLLLLSPASGICQSQKASIKPADNLRPALYRVRGGLVNLSEGDVEYIRGSSPARPLRFQQELSKGDVVSVGAEGRVEILLNPGCYLRLFNGTRVSLLDLSADNMKVKVWRGSAIIEIAINQPVTFSTAEDVIYEPITVVTPQNEFGIARGGVYRLNVSADGTSDLRVLKGLAVVAGSEVKDGLSASASKGKVAIAPLDKKTDAFDSWSRNRAAVMVLANKSMNKASWYKQVREHHTSVVVEDPEDARRANEMRTVSAQNGLVAFVEDGSLLKSGESTWQKLRAGDKLTNADRLRTSSESRAEIHSYPICYVFFGSNTEITYLEGNDGHVSVNVLRGSVIILLGPDLRARDQKSLPSLTLTADKVDYEISVKGTYRFNVIPGGTTEMIVSAGKIKVAGREIIGPREFTVTDGAFAERSLDKPTVDSFDLWSSRRSKPWIPSLRRRLMAGGVWLANGEISEYTFVPGNWNYRSPYGGEYLIKYAPDNWMQQERRQDFKDPIPPAGPTRP